jgi:predicted RNA-binding Zn-ribbon protein involved in translation (DUF1610 family)
MNVTLECKYGIDLLTQAGKFYCRLLNMCGGVVIGKLQSCVNFL